MKQYEKSINSKGSRNKRFVIIKENRVCHNCGNTINKGTKCLTLNPKMQARYWVCLNCVNKQLNLNKQEQDLLKRYRQTLAEMNTLAFDDEGGYMALQDYLVELEAEMNSAGIDIPS